MPITKPQLPPRKGYVEIEIDGKRTYKKIEDEPSPTKEDRIAALEEAMLAMMEAQNNV